MSFSDIGEIKRRVFGESISYKKKKKKLSKVAQALELFSKNKTPIDVAIELDIDPKDVEKIYLNYLGLNGLTQIVNIHQELGNYLQDFISFYWSFREGGADNKKIKEILEVADRISELNSELKRLQNESKNLQIKIQKKTISLQNVYEQIEIITNLFNIEYCKWEKLLKEIDKKESELWNLKTLIRDVEAEEGFLYLEKKVKESIIKITMNESINIPLTLVAVMDAC